MHFNIIYFINYLCSLCMHTGVYICHTHSDTHVEGGGLIAGVSSLLLWYKAS